MAVFNRRFLAYIKSIFENVDHNTKDSWKNDILVSRFFDIELSNKSTFLSARQCARIAGSDNILTILNTAFPDGILNRSIDKETERKTVSLKSGFPRMPTTTASIILKGFGLSVSKLIISDIYSSHGFSQNMKCFSSKRDFEELNRHAAGLAQVMAKPKSDAAQRFIMRWNAIKIWKRKKQETLDNIIAKLPMSRSLFFHWLNKFSRMGITGLADQGKELFRLSKITPASEAQIIIDRLQHPDRSDRFYVQRLHTKGITVKRDSVAKIFQRWKIDRYKSEFISNLKRLEKKYEDDLPQTALPTSDTAPSVRLVDEYFLYQLAGLKSGSMSVNAPGLYALWTYIEELGLFRKLDSMGLTVYEKRQQYSWFDLLLFEIGRRFYGIATFSAACNTDGPDLPFFAAMYTHLCNDSLLAGLRKISEKQVVILRQWLVERLTQLGLTDGRFISFDFHHIDQGVIFPNLREFGKGPSPKKKLCATGFRPHIAWDTGSGTLLVAEFRKASARGTTTVKRFVCDYILPVFSGLFDTVYLDSEYTGTDVWNFIINEKKGMGAHLTACLKQNPLVRKARDQFLAQNSSYNDFWCYYDDEHVFSKQTFTINWKYSMNENEQRTMKLNCVVKKHLTTGRLRCFGTTKEGLTSRQILEDYSSRWGVENGIKDLIISYFLDKCPGTDPHLVDIHFLIVTVCRALYRMMERDLKEHIHNDDGTVKTLNRMRELLIRPGAAEVKLCDNNINVKYSNAFSAKTSRILREWFAAITDRFPEGLEVLGGLKVNFILNVPQGEERRNSGTKLPLADVEKILA